MTHNLYGSSDLASRVVELAAVPGFPHPVWGTGRHRVWHRADIAATQRAGDDPPSGAS